MKAKKLKPTNAQLQRRRRLVTEWWLEGHATRVIAEAFGVSQSTISNDLIAVGIRAGKERRRTSSSGQNLPKVDWQSPVLRRQAPYLSSEPVLTLATLLQAADEESWTQLLAQHLQQGADDPEWLETTKARVDAAFQLMRRWLYMTDNDRYRDDVANSSRVRPPSDPPILQIVGARSFT